VTEHKKTTQKSGGFHLVFPESSPKTVTFLDLRLGCDPARARTEDPKIKSLLLYQLSYGVKNKTEPQINMEFILPENFSPYLCSPLNGSIAQLVQSICLTSRGSAVRTRVLPHNTGEGFGKTGTLLLLESAPEWGMLPEFYTPAPL
jgi:hypothetical protein